MKLPDKMSPLHPIKMIIFLEMDFSDLEDPEEGVARREGHGGGG